MKFIQGIVCRALTPLNQFHGDKTAEVELKSLGAVSLNRQLRENFEVGEHVVLISLEDYRLLISELTKEVPDDARPDGQEECSEGSGAGTPRKRGYRRRASTGEAD